MKKIAIIFIVVLALITAGSIFLQMFSLSTKKSSVVPTVPPIPTPVINTSNSNKPSTTTQVVSVFPQDGSTDIDVNQPISITFNEPVENKDFSLSFAPAFPYTASTSGSVVTITPTQSLSPNVLYSGFVQVSSFPAFQFSFSTITDPNSPSPSPDIAQEVTLEEQRVFFPDQYVDNFLPYQTTDFSVAGAWTDQPAGHFYAIVALSGNQQQAKQDFITWLQSIGITNTQLSKLDIRYQ